MLGAMSLGSRLATIFASVSGLLVLAPASLAHIEIEQKRVPTGKAATVTFEAENEQSDSRTVKLDIQLPSGVTSVSPRKVGGWRVALKRSGGEVDRLTVTAPKGKGFGPGEVSRAFSFSMRFAPGPARSVSFKAIQTYENGFVARWIGPRGSEEPAPRLRLAAASKPAPAKSAPAPATDTAEDDSDDDGDSGTVIAAVGVAVVIGAILLALFWARRRRRSG
jgi:periplasmic copper chaperone A